MSSPRVKEAERQRLTDIEGKTKEPWLDVFRREVLTIIVVWLALMVETTLASTLSGVGPEYIAMTENIRLSSNTSIEIYNDISVKAGLLLGVGHFCAMLAGLTFGTIVEIIGHKVPLIIGATVATIALAAFTVSTMYWQLIACRIINSIGNGISSTAGMALLADIFVDDDVRTQKESIAVSGYTIGLVLGFGVSSVMFEFIGPRSPFYAICIMSALDVILRFGVKEPETITHKKKDVSCRSFTQVIVDPYVFLPLFCLFVNIFSFRATIATKVTFLIEKFDAEVWQIGMVLLIPTVLQLSAQFFVGKYATRIGRWLVCMVGLILNGIGLIVWPSSPSIWFTMIPETILRIGWSIVMTVIMPLVGFVVDERHEAQHGIIYGMYFATYHFSSFTGPTIGGLAMEIMSVATLYRIMGLVVIATSFVSYAFKTIPPKHGGHYGKLDED